MTLRDLHSYSARREQALRRFDLLAEVIAITVANTGFRGPKKPAGPGDFIRYPDTQKADGVPASCGNANALRTWVRSMPNVVIVESNHANEPQDDGD